MALTYYDADLNALITGNPLETFHDGHVGQSHEQVFYIRNHDAALYYTDIVIQPEFTGGGLLPGDLGSGWSIKVIIGTRRPTEAEWDVVKNGDPATYPDIGTMLAADTTTNHPVWVRVYCPGNEMSQIKENMRITVSYYDNLVGD